VSGDAGYNPGRTGIGRKSCACAEDTVECWDVECTLCFHGTSAAAPMVSAVAALVLSVRPDLQAGEVRAILEETARRIPAPESPPYGDDPSGRPRSRAVGFGCVSAADAVRAASRHADLGRRTPYVPPSAGSR
jgi:subtilisin family serine protease